MSKKLAWAGIAVMTTLLGLVAFWQFRTVVIIVLVSLALAAAVRPVVAQHWVGQKLVMRLVFTMLIVMSLGVSGILIVLMASSTIDEVRHLGNTVAVQDEWKLPSWLSTIREPGSGNSISMVDRLPAPSQLFTVLTGDQGELVLPAILGITRGIAGFASGLLVILFLSIYWSLNQVHFERLWLSLLPPGQRNRTRNTWYAINIELGTYLRSQVIQSILAGLVLGLGYWALGSPYPTLLGLAGALSSLIPMVGLGLAMILPLSIGLITSVQLGMLTAAYTLVILIALNVWVKPRLLNHRQYNPILAVVILIALAKAFGFIGIIAAPPLSAAIQILWSHLAFQRAVSSGTASQISSLKERQILLMEAVAAMEDPPPLVTSSMEQLSGLFEKAEPVLQELFAVEPKD
jgi:putative permease